MANTYPSLSVKGMIYIYTRGAHRYPCRHKKPHKGDVVDQKTPYTLHVARKSIWVRWCMMCLNPKCTTSMGTRTTLQTEHRTRLQAQFNTYDVSFPTSRRRRGGGGVVPRMRSNFILSSMGHIYIYLYIYIYTPIQCANNFESWLLDEANPMVQRWQIRALLAVGYHLHSTRFCHMYNLEDSIVELKHNAQTSKNKHFSFVLQNLPYLNCPNLFF